MGSEMCIRDRIYSFTCLSLLLMLFCLTAAHVVVVVVVVVVAFCVEVQRSRANLLTGVVLDLGRTATLRPSLGGRAPPTTWP